MLLQAEERFLRLVICFKRSPGFGDAGRFGIGAVAVP